MSDRAAPTTPGRSAIAIDVSVQDQTLPECRGIYVGNGGDITVDMVGAGRDILYKAVPTGTLLPIQVMKVKNVGTTATNLVAIY